MIAKITPLARLIFAFEFLINGLNGWWRVLLYGPIANLRPGAMTGLGTAALTVFGVVAVAIGLWASGWLVLMAAR